MSVFGDIGATLSSSADARARDLPIFRGCPDSPAAMTRIPLLAGSRLVVVTADDDAIVLQPPPPEDVADVGAAVRDALRFPRR